MQQKKTRREIYDKNYYIAQTLLQNPKFQKRIQWLKDTFARFGCPIPASGFKTQQEYTEWNEGFWTIFGKLEESQEYKNKIKEITGGKPTYGLKEYNEIENFRAEFLPPLYGQYFQEILEEFGISRKDKGFKDFLEYHVFFNKDIYPTNLFKVRWIRNPKTEKAELFVQILGHTKKEDIIEHWNWIAQEQKYLSDYQAKNKEWSAFSRDNEVYEVYSRIKSERNTKRAKKTDGQRAVDEEIYVDVAQKYPNLTLSHIRKIIAKVKKFRATPKGSV